LFSEEKKKGREGKNHEPRVVLHYKTTHMPSISQAHDGFRRSGSFTKKGIRTQKTTVTGGLRLLQGKPLSWEAWENEGKKSTWGGGFVGLMIRRAGGG